jgi:hypothetical protein
MSNVDAMRACTAETLLDACARAWPLLGTLPTELAHRLLTTDLARADAAALVRACLPRAMVVTEWRQGKRREYALGRSQRHSPRHPGDALRPVVLWRGGVHDLRTFAEPRWDRDEVGLAMRALRGLVRARDCGRRDPVLARECLQGFGTPDEWRRRVVRLLSGMDQTTRQVCSRAPPPIPFFRDQTCPTATRICFPWPVFSSRTMW